MTKIVESLKESPARKDLKQKKKRRQLNLPIGILTSDL